MEQPRIFFENQKCEAIQVQVSETYDASYGVLPGAGFTMSGINMIIGVKSGYPRIKAANSVG